MRKGRNFACILAAWAIVGWLAMLSASGAAFAAANVFDQTVLHPAIPLLDETGQHVLNSGQPYSTKMSCGNGNGSGCHDYDKMNHAYHFEQGRDEADDSFGQKHGLSHLVSPGYFGGYNCMQGSSTGALAKKSNANAADFADWGAAGFVKACSSCHTGGGWEEKDRTGVRYDQMPADKIADKDGDYFERDGNGGLVRWDWQKSGVREADCLTCHADFTLLKKFPASQLGGNDGADQTDTAFNHWGWLQDQKFVKNGFFRYANSAMFEFLNVRPDLPDGASLLSVARQVTPNTPKPDYQLSLNGQGLPILQWNRAAFDTSAKIQIPMRRFPSSDNCMMCHLAGAGINRIVPKVKSSRRGFYGFGDDSVQHYGTDGLLIPDAKDDVHKGTTWLDDTGESRVIDNCNACHSKQYYKPLYANIDLDADHNFPKGDGDADIRNDLDKQPGPFSCEYCHDTAKSPALPSGHKTILAAHRELWKARGDMAGYAPDTLNKVTQVHLDVVSCQTCHITNVTYNGETIKLRYRYRLAENGKLKSYPYKPASRFYAKDKNSGRVLYRYERESVFQKKTGADGKDYGAIIDPTTQQEVGKVTVNAAGEFGTPTTYDDYKAWKRAYDNLLKAKGYKNPDVRFVYIESNEYIVTHQTRPAVQAMVCTECHTRKQNGSINSLIAPNGIYGAGNVAEVAKLPDRRLVDEGVVELGMPYYKVDGSGRITENVEDVLYTSKINPSMTILDAQMARDVAGEFVTAEAGAAVGFAGLTGGSGNKLMQRMNSGEWLLFNPAVGHESLRSFALILPGNFINRGTLQNARVEAEAREPVLAERKRIKSAGFGKLVTDILSFSVSDASKFKLTAFTSPGALVKLPYQGQARSVKRVKVVYSEDGKRWQAVPAKDVVDFNPPGGQTPAYVVVSLTKPVANLAVADK
jgi:hypothetical protein